MINLPKLIKCLTTWQQIGKISRKYT